MKSLKAKVSGLSCGVAARLFINNHCGNHRDSGSMLQTSDFRLGTSNLGGIC